MSLVHEGFDLAFRIGALPDRATVTNRLGIVRAVVCASPRYLRDHGTPTTPHDLREHALVELASMGAFGAGWRFVKEGGRALTIRAVPRLVVNDASAAVAASAAGLGLTRVLHYQARADLADGRLQLVLERYKPRPLPASIVFANGRPASAAVREFADAARPYLSAALMARPAVPRMP